MACWELSMSPFLKRTWARVFQQSPLVGLSLIFIGWKLHFCGGTLQLIFRRLAASPGSFPWGRTIWPFLSFCLSLDRRASTDRFLELVDLFQEEINLFSAFLGLVWLTVVFPLFEICVDFLFQGLHLNQNTNKNNEANPQNLFFNKIQQSRHRLQVIGTV